MREAPWWTFFAGAGAFGVIAGYGLAFAGEAGLLHRGPLVPLFAIGAAGTILLAIATVGLAVSVLLRRPGPDAVQP